MTENAAQLTGQPAANSTVGIEAELIFLMTGRAPDVILSFDGKFPPTQMLAELAQLGWGTPRTPPPPGTAIEWTPDPAAGTEYTIRSWRVTHHRLQRSESWTPEIEAGMGAATIRVLRQHDATITGLRGAAAEEIAAATAPAPEPVAAPPAGAISILLSQEATDTPAGLTSWTAKSGRQRAPWQWSEGAPIAQSDAERLDAADAHAWILHADTRPTPSSGKALIQMVCLETKGADKQVSKLAKLFGAPPSALELHSSTGGANALLIASEVPANSLEMVSSNLLLRFPKMILRD